MPVIIIVFVFVLTMGTGIVLCLLPPFESQILLLALCASVFFAYLTNVLKNVLLKYLSLGIFSLLLPLTVMEGYYYFALRPFQVYVEHERIQRSNTAQEGYQVKATRKVGIEREVLYDVVYSFDAKDRRITPRAPHARTAVVLLGCSFTFGDGLEDTQTLPYQLATLLGEDYQVFNLGVSGSGPHKLLGDLTHLFEEIRHFERVFIYYVAIGDHCNRVAGIALWEDFGPLYVLENGSLVMKGTLDAALPFFERGTFKAWLQRSWLFKKVRLPLKKLFAHLPREEDRLALVHALIARMNAVIKDNLPQGHFTVLAWPPGTARMLTPLPQHISLVDVEPWLPDYAQSQELYVIRPRVDTHPTAYATLLVAKELENVLRNTALP